MNEVYGTQWNPSGDVPPEDDPRARVLQAMMGKSSGSGTMAVLATLAKAAAAQQMKQRQDEARQNKQLGVNPTAPAFDDQGNAMPRAPGMAQPTLMQRFQNFFGPSE